MTALLFFTVNWEGQFYYSPQSTAFLLALLFQFSCCRCSNQSAYGGRSGTGLGFGFHLWRSTARKKPLL